MKIHPIAEYWAHANSSPTWMPPQSWIWRRVRMAAGSLQVSHDGQPILLLADHPTTGGYPVIALSSPPIFRWQRSYDRAS